MSERRFIETLFIASDHKISPGLTIVLPLLVYGSGRDECVEQGRRGVTNSMFVGSLYQPHLVLVARN